jgi:hypothetical protein
MKGKLGAYFRFLWGLPAYLNTPISYDEARQALVDRLTRREAAFLSLVRRAVYGNPSSPYLPLFVNARCEYGDVEQGVRLHGLEGFLKQAKDAGVWISLDEFKGASAIRRGALEIPVTSDSFRNPWVSRGFEASTGGTSGRSTRTRLDLDFNTERATYAHLMFKMLDIYDVPLALWYPRLPAGTGIGNTIRYAKIGHPPERWFCMLPDASVKPGIENRLATDFVIWASRLTRTPLARPEPVTIARVGTVVDWMAGHLRRGGRCVLQTYVSQAVRVSQAAAERGLSLKGALFIVGSEPLTAAKLREIESVGATVFPRYHTTELGAVATGCGNPREVGEYHLATDSVAIVEGPAGALALVPLYLTSLLASAPVIMINVEFGDEAVVDTHPCGCLWEELGLTTHLRRVGNSRRAKGEGMTVDARELLRVAEEVLPARFGGSSVDYQWVEEEDERAFTRLWLRIDPRLGELDEGKVVETILSELRKTPGGALAAEMWRQAGTIRILREPPRATSAGKTLPWRKTLSGA